VSSGSLVWPRDEAGTALPACYDFSSVPPVEPDTEIVFYDGHCGLCNHAVQFVLKHDRSGRAFRFAPLQGTTYPSRVSAEQRAMLPNSIILLTQDGNALTRSDAFVHIFRRLGGGWRTLAGALALIPRPVRDFVYDFVARIRYHIFGRRDDICPVMPPELSARFDP
jgi:predicted DCC family thiol-disulfide oxidoreductase YuxK